MTRSLNIVIQDCNRGPAIEGGWEDGVFLCSCDATYDHDGVEMWLQISAVRDEGVWYWESTDLDYMDVKFNGKLYHSKVYEACPQGEKYFDEHIRDAFEHYYKNWVASREENK